ncbi:MAG: PAS domain-containing sensor histidine kinase, partial [Deltaproteobacteria bacterium]|nr:PAS domain-containing sensor histidine kinase [Nannocystaceae bacterium]
MSVDAALGAVGDAPTATHPGEDPASPQLYRELLESISEHAIFMLDREGRVATWNRGAELIKGYRADEIIGRPLATFYTADDLAAGLPARLLATAATVGRVEDEGWRVRKDGSRLWAGVVITALRDDRGGLRGFAKVTRDLTQRVQLEDERVRAARAEEAVRLREEFLAVASHQLRTPLTAMLLGLHGVHERLLAAGDSLAERLSRSLASGKRLADLIERLLDVSRLSNQQLVITREPVLLGGLVEQAVAATRARAERVGCALRCHGPVGVIGSWDRLR